MEFTSIAKYHSIYKRLCFVHVKQFGAQLLDFYMENTLVRSEFSKEACNTWCYDGASVTRGSCSGEQKCAEERASLLLPALLLQPSLAHALLHAYQKSWV